MTPSALEPSRHLSAVPVLCDIDGVVWLDHHPIPGSVEAVARLRSAGHRVLFVTNNSGATASAQERALGAIGIPATGDVVTSAQAAASLVEPGERVLNGGGPSIAEEVTLRGADVVEVGDVLQSGEGSVDPVRIRVDAAIVAMRRDFDYDWLHIVSSAVRDGARFIASGVDPTYPTPAGMRPGTGSLVAAVQVASGKTPIVAGKPHEPMASLAAHRLGREIGDLAQALMVGDRWSTDGAFAGVLGCRFGLVRSGAIDDHAGADNHQGAAPNGGRSRRSPTFAGDTLADIVDQFLQS